jgi:drug/metabolite transporter (DMT)-like permease
MAAGISRAAGHARRRGQLYVALAAVAWSSAGVLQRELTVDTRTQLAGRAVFAFLFLAGVVVVSARGGVVAAVRAIGPSGLGVAVCTAVASGSFIVALNHAKVANVLFMQAVAPIVAALLAWAALGERVSRRTWLAMAVAVLGVALMVGSPGSGGLLGISVSLLMTLSFATGLVFTRHRSDVSMVPAICLAQLLVFLVAAPFAEAGAVTARDLGLFVLLGVGQIGLGLLFLVTGARLIPAAEVALITLLEIVLAPLWVWISIGEKPAAATLLGGVVVVGAVVLQATGRERNDVVAAGDEEGRRVEDSAAEQIPLPRAG